MLKQSTYYSNWIFFIFRMEEIKTYYKFKPDEIFRRITVTSLATLMIECSKLEYQEEDSDRLTRFVIKTGYLKHFWHFFLLLFGFFFIFFSN